MNRVDKIKNIILDFQQKQDKLYSRYQAAEKEAREKYSESGYRSNFLLNEWPQYASRAQSNSDSTIREVMDIFDAIREDFESFMMKPLGADIISILNCVSNFSLNLSMKELQILEKNISSESYIGMRIFSELASKNGYIVKVPAADEYLKALENARNNTRFLIAAYAGRGPEYPGRDLLGEWEWQGTKIGELQDIHLLMSENILKQGNELDRLSELFDSARQPLQYTLNHSETEKVKKQLDKIVDHGEIDKKAANELLKAEPDFKNRFESLPKEELKKYESVSKYFGLTDNKKEKLQESKISPSMEQAAKYMSNRQPVDENLLAKFK